MNCVKRVLEFLQAGATMDQIKSVVVYDELIGVVGQDGMALKIVMPDSKILKIDEVDSKICEIYAEFRITADGNRNIIIHEGTHPKKIIRIFKNYVRIYNPATKQYVYESREKMFTKRDWNILIAGPGKYVTQKDFDLTRSRLKKSTRRKRLK